MSYRITLPSGEVIAAKERENLLQVLRRGGQFVPAYCGGAGTCGKCEVLVDGKRRLACSVTVEADLLIGLPEEKQTKVLTTLPSSEAADIKETDERNFPSGSEGFDAVLSVDVGTTTLAAYLAKEDGTILDSAGCLNPQGVFGADVITRLRYVRDHGKEELTGAVRSAVKELFEGLLKKNGQTFEQVTSVAAVGNPAMQQLFMGLPVDNLLDIPYHPLITEGRVEETGDILPVADRAGHALRHIVVPDIGAYVGADTVAAAISEELDLKDETTLLVDIGTNGEMMLALHGHLYACATAAGPAFEGASIHFGMRAAEGAIDHVELSLNGRDQSKLEGAATIHCHVIGETKARGICGSGLMDAVSAFLDMGLLDKRGRILAEGGILPLSEQVYLTQDDIRALQSAKGAVAAGIELLMKEAGVSEKDISKVLLAGAFGSFIRKESACRIGLLPKEMLDRIYPVGNAAGMGSVKIAVSAKARMRADRIAKETKLVDLAAHPDFERSFAKNMYFNI